MMQRLWSQQDGQDIAEYAVMMAVILVLVAGTVRLIGSVLTQQDRYCRKLNHSVTLGHDVIVHHSCSRQTGRVAFGGDTQRRQLHLVSIGTIFASWSMFAFCRVPPKRDSAETA